MELVIYTVGHSTHGFAEFVELLKVYGIGRVVDVRTVPRSRNNPQFNGDELARTLKNRRISYRHLKELGGLRHSRRDSPNTGWHNDSFRGFADYMQTPEFSAGIEKLIALAREKKTAIMCAEAVPWRCHRSLIADALVVRGIEVKHIMSEKGVRDHEVNPMAAVSGTTITYPGNPSPPCPSP